MSKYPYILFDADDTLFHFNPHSGLREMFLQSEIAFTLDHLETFKKINNRLWDAFQKGEISAQNLKEQRFAHLAAEFNKTSLELNDLFLKCMYEDCAPIDGAISLLNKLKGRATLGMVTNGFTNYQQERLEKSGLTNHFDIYVISEEIGIAKPNRKIFDHALALMGNPNRDSVLMIGDSLDSDIQGGLNAGIHTCWFNLAKNSINTNIKPHYEVNSHQELENILT
ncbi:haloacid dehalogenase (plasmid) [Legionella adelaidensis]|uniref:Haloacid dehalogenase n=1 Tax=Legionella adelaidensis TaxID=45056 RepID=A0A0W0R1U5_9GAMM|nr:pyrimidine 5'-nucleotidase [Legionella adelaidensis]KTC65002.1 haloacid dehalogenase [Legionella adelaidensis]VEH85318.1 haloacid dehalogenase [Legionella adelaidensis]